MRVSVLVPSYRRPADLSRCLAAIGGQIRAADQVLVVARKGDEETLAVSKEWQNRLPLELIEVELPGVVHALNAGLARCVGDILAITDDDAAPRPDWLQRMEAHYVADPRIGGVGGRDWMYNNGVLDLGDSAVVGRILWYGRIIGAHHRGVGPVRDVDVLKGVNSSFRITAIRPIGFDTRLRGSGAQVHHEILAGLRVKRAGWRLIYDPELAVDHYPGARHDRDQRLKLDLVATENRAFNLRLALNEIEPGWLRMMAFAWQLGVGTIEEPGLIWLWRHRLRGTKNILIVYRATIAGWRQAAKASKIRNVRELA
jgi:cellulose synthase/poly-beta-1,6-N-acetylglucosamine synthase-like glycosyltransferase